MADQLFYKRRQQRVERTSKKLSARNEIWLIVSEGTETEPNYFNGLYSYLLRNFPDQMRIKFKVKGLGKNTQSLVKSVDEFYDYTDQLNRISKIKYGKTFVVFDKDSFKADQFDNAIFQAESKGYIPLWSNECFELWFLLHFKFLNSNVTRELYSKQLSTCFKEKYDKTQLDIFNTLLLKGGNLKSAIKNSTKLFEDSCEISSPSLRGPCTYLFRFFEELQKHTSISFLD